MLCAERVYGDTCPLILKRVAVPNWWPTESYWYMGPIYKPSRLCVIAHIATDNNVTR